MRGSAGVTLAFLLFVACREETAAAAPDSEKAPAVARHECIQPSPLNPEGKVVPWRHDRTGLLTVTQGRPNHRAADMVVAEGDRQVLSAKFAYGPADKDLEDEDVDVYVLDDPPCGKWVRLGTARTTDDDDTSQVEGIPADEGLAFFEVPEDKRLPAGRHPVQMVVRGDHSAAAFDLYVLKPGTPAVVFDIDGTLTTDDFQVVREIFEKIVTHTYVPRMLVRSEDTVIAYASAGYLPVYLTGRPEILARPTREWLRAKSFPPGILVLAQSAQDVLPIREGVGRYKAGFLQRAVRCGLEIQAAYGNAPTDIDAYELAGISKKSTYIVGKNRGMRNTQPIRNYREHLKELGAIPPADHPFSTWDRW
jgi:hypothetical protein